jgi:hypothetical protein
MGRRTGVGQISAHLQASEVELILCNDDEKTKRGMVKLTGFPKGEPDSLYYRDSPWISIYHIQNLFQSNITDITHVYNITWVYLLHNPKDCITHLRVQAPWAKRKQTKSRNDI